MCVCVCVQAKQSVCEAARPGRPWRDMDGKMGGDLRVPEIGAGEEECGTWVWRGWKRGLGSAERASWGYLQCQKSAVTN